MKPKLVLQPALKERVLFQHRVAGRLGILFAWLHLYNTWPVIWLLDVVDGRSWRSTGAPMEGHMRLAKPKASGRGSSGGDKAQP